MALIFHEGTKHLIFDITGYHMDHLTDDLRGDWLNVRIQYTNGTEMIHINRPMLLTSELEKLALRIEEISDGEETGFIFSSPDHNFLQIAMTRFGSMTALQISFENPEPEADDEDRKYICEGLRAAGLDKIREQFKKWTRTYPYAQY